MNHMFLLAAIASAAVAIRIAVAFFTKVLPALGNDEPHGRHPS